MGTPSLPAAAVGNLFSTGMERLVAAWHTRQQIMVAYGLVGRRR